MEGEKNYFELLNAVNVNANVEKKNNLDYLSWAWAWAEIKKRYPDTTYTVYKTADGCIYHNDGRTCWVEVGVTCNGIEHIEYLPIMDHRNASIPLERVTSFDVNKSIKRALTKAIADHGIGLYIYAGEDLPEEDKAASVAAAPQKKVAICASCGKPITAHGSTDADTIVRGTFKTYGRPLCYDCSVAEKAKSQQGNN